MTRSYDADRIADVVHALVMLAGAMFCSLFATALFTAAFANVMAMPGQTLEQAAETPAVIAVGLTVQSVIALALYTALHKTFDTPFSHPPWALTDVARVVLASLLVGFLPGWVGSCVQPYVGGGPGTVGLLEQQFGGPFAMNQLLLSGALVIGAPVVEELAFRSFLWHHLRRVLSPMMVWLCTSVAFCVFHLDLVQSIALLPTALFFGWIRWRTGSVSLAIIAHATNNALAVLFMLTSPAIETGVGIALVTTVVCWSIVLPRFPHRE